MVDKIEQLREQFIETLKNRGSLGDPLLEAAFRAVPRHLFLPHLPPEVVYADSAIPVESNLSGITLSSCSQPSMIATMLAQLRLEPGQNILEIGAGTGYNAALMQFIVGDMGKVTTIEIDQHIASMAQDSLQRLGIGSKITLVQADGAMGYAPRASYDRILASVSVWDVPYAWKRQLKPDGILVTPIWLDTLQVCAAFHQMPDGALFSSENVPARFVSLRGPGAGPMMQRRVGTSSLLLTSTASRYFDTAALHMLLSNDVEVNHLGCTLTELDYWQSFVPYLMLNLPSGYHFALYDLINNMPVYSLTSPGFALISQTSACFVPYDGHGSAVGFAGSDAFVDLQNILSRWCEGVRSTADQLRLRLTPVAQGMPPVTTGQVYVRHDHVMHVWFASREASTL